MLLAVRFVRDSGDEEPDMTPAQPGWAKPPTLAPEQGGKGWTAAAEPARYGSTGRLSFHIDQSGTLRKEDRSGKPIKGS